MKTITGQVNAYITQYSPLRPEQLANPTAGMVGNLQYTDLMTPPTGWTLVGKATITVEMVNTDDLIANKVEALRTELHKHRADSHLVAMRLEDQISKLLAISYEGAA